MSEMKYTRGPWQFYADLPSVEPNWHIVTNASRLRVLANVHIEPGNLVDEANAHLISAAPDMYEALKAAVECGMVPVTSVSDGGAARFSRQVEVADMIRAALQKATPPEIQ